MTSDLPEFAWNKECIAQSDPAVLAAPSPIDSPFRRHVKPGTATMHKSTEDHFFARSTLLSFDANILEQLRITMECCNGSMVMRMT